MARCAREMGGKEARFARTDQAPARSACIRGNSNVRDTFNRESYNTKPRPRINP